MSTQKLPLIVKALLIADIGLGCAYVVYFLLGAPFVKLWTLLDLDSENSIATWYSSVQLFGIAALGGVFLYRHNRRTGLLSWTLLVLPLGFLVLSMDEIVMIHEWLGSRADQVFLESGDRRDSSFHITGIWMFALGIPFLVGFLCWVYLIRGHFSAKPGSLTKFVLGILVLLSGALLFEGLANLSQDMNPIYEAVTLNYVLNTFGEETLEMLGATLMFWSMYELNSEHIAIKT